MGLKVSCLGYPDAFHDKVQIFHKCVYILNWISSSSHFNRGFGMSWKQTIKGNLIAASPHLTSPIPSATLSERRVWYAGGRTAARGQNSCIRRGEAENTGVQSENWARASGHRRHCRPWSKPRFDSLLPHGPWVCLNKGTICVLGDCSCRWLEEWLWGLGGERYGSWRTR